MNTIFKTIGWNGEIPTFSDFVAGQQFPVVESFLRGVDEMTDDERTELFKDARELAYYIAFRAGIIITDDEEVSYAKKFMEKYSPLKSKYRQMESIIAADYAA